MIRWAQQRKSMDKEDIGSRLRSLAKNDQRPKMARMRDIFDDIENALKAKVPHLVLVEELNNSGLDVSLKVFRTMLLRIRKERASDSIVNPVKNQTPSVNASSEINKPAADTPLPTQRQEEQSPPVGIVDVFTKQAEREAKKAAEAKIQKIPRR